MNQEEMKIFRQIWKSKMWIEKDEERDIEK